MASNAAVASATKKVVPAAEEEKTPSAEPHVVPVSPTPNVDRTAASPASPTVAAPHRTEAPAAPGETTTKSAPLKDISLQVNQPGKERVDVRVVQQGSEVHVSVHSGDASLTTGLRHGLSELQSRLEESGFRSEMWRPGSATAPVSASPSAQSSGNHPRGGDGQPQQHGQSQQESGASQSQPIPPTPLGRRNGIQFWEREIDRSFYGFTR
ncbi:MAG: hypothetical protein WDO73_04760 [Ignavibacteriota bacterium]